MITRVSITFGIYWLAISTVAIADAPAPDQLGFFETKIRPVLAERCYRCHSDKSEKIKGGLLLDTREGIRRGGENGPAVVPGNLDESLLIQAIRYTNKEFQMPPEKTGGKLPDATIKDFEKWITMGAADPRDGAAKVVKKYDTTEAKNWWAFQAPKKTETPRPTDSKWPRGDIDKYILSAMEAKGIKPVADADKLTLIRRVYFDLIGLPPTPQEADAFVKDTSTGAFEKVVDRLLASPRFGERWGRHWLDVARYAESSGKDVNVAFPHAWRYRDYVIAAFNVDKPYDQFIREQIAGDLLPSKDDQQRAEQVIATGFLAIGTKSLNEMNPRQFFLDLADEQIDTTSQAILGLTVACARCHDHKFDPIPQREYYSMAGIFLSTDTRFGTPRSIQNRHATDLLELPKGAGAPILAKAMTPAERAEKAKQLEELKKEGAEAFRARMESRREGKEDRTTPQQQQRNLQLVVRTGMLDTELKQYNDDGQPKALAMGVQELPTSSTGAPFGGPPGMGRFLERFARPPEFQRVANSAVYARGDVSKPGEKVSRGFVSVLSHGNTPAIPAGESGRRELADWIVSRDNPLTARVLANRVWAWLFGRGIVPSTDNFGNSGQKPDNQALLDFLAVSLVDNGWSMKKLIREIVLSRAYQLSSTYNEKNFHADPDDTLVWRMSKRRLDAECIHDAMLAVNNQLQLTPPVGSAIARAGDGPIGGPRFRGTSEATVTAEVNSRSVYQAVARDLLPDSLAVFDFAEPSLVVGAREKTNVPSQALYLLNSPFVTQQAEKLAERIMAANPAGPNGSVTANFDQRVRDAYWIVLSRPPTNAERQAASNFFVHYPTSLQKPGPGGAGALNAAEIKAGWTSFCRALFACAEFRYLD